MIEERHLELIHGDLDGELTPEQRAELSELLRASPEARGLREELSRLSGALAAVKSVDPPPDLTKWVLQALDRRSSRDPSGAQRVGLTSATRSLRMPLRYAAMFAAGVLVSAGVFRLGFDQASLPDVSEIAGTIGGHERAAGAPPVGRLKIDLPQVNGSASAYEIHSDIVLELDVNARQPVRVVAAQDDHSVSVNVAGRPDAAPERFFWVTEAGGSPVALTIFSGDTLLYRGVLQISRVNESKQRQSE
jgi:anti-sigma factor RsiW